MFKFPALEHAKNVVDIMKQLIVPTPDNFSAALSVTLIRAVTAVS